MSDIKNSIKNLEKCLELEKGTLEKSFLSNLLRCLNFIEEIITGIATSPAIFKRPYMAEGVTCVISNLSLLRTLFMEDYADGNYTVH